MAQRPHPLITGAIRSVAIVLPMLALAFLATPAPSHAQQPAKLYRMGYLTTSGPPASNLDAHNCPVKGSSFWQSLVGGLRERGYVQGRNLVIDCRYSDGNEERALPLVNELLALNVDLLVAFSMPNIRAAKQSTSTVPIVMVGVIDPVGRGMVASLARPGGNLTGLANDAGREIGGKQLQLLKEAVPRVSRVAVLAYELRPRETIFRPYLEAAAPALGVALQFYEVREPEELESAFAAMTKARAEALLVLQSPFMWNHRQRIVELGARSGLPALYPERDFIAAGGLLAYGADQLAGWRRVGYYVDKILQGAKPADLPVERPAKFELMINLKTAKSLGLAIPQALLTQADEVIH